MGMDVYGIKPHSQKGEYFRNNIWWWHPLWDYCSFVAPELCSKVTEAHNNSGDGLNGVDARKLSFIINKSIEAGVAQEYVTSFEEVKLELEDVECYCRGSFSLQENSLSPQECGLCKGSGLMSHPNKSYFIDMDNIKEFSAFLLDCGGFTIC
jgi:hypothetical protein